MKTTGRSLLLVQGCVMGTAFVADGIVPKDGCRVPRKFFVTKACVTLQGSLSIVSVLSLTGETIAGAECETR